jgi:TPR repeat protein
VASRARDEMVVKVSRNGLDGVLMRHSGPEYYAEAIRYQNGDGVRKDWKKAFTLMSQAAATGHPVARTTLGSYYDYGRSA